jgi:hypothetical protein
MRGRVRSSLQFRGMPLPGHENPIEYAAKDMHAIKEFLKLH